MLDSDPDKRILVYGADDLYSGIVSKDSFQTKLLTCIFKAKDGIGGWIAQKLLLISNGQLEVVKRSVRLAT